jgi:Glycosyltransferase family 87
LFLPLGFVAGVPAGLALWYVAQFAALAGAAWVLARALMPGDGWRGALLILALIAALPTTLMNVDNAQTNFILLLLIALAFRHRNAPSGAVWEMLAVWVKPYAAALLLLDAVRRQWRRLLVAALTAAVTFAGAALVLGPATLATYVRSNPATREPAYAFTEFVNQSLLAIVLRMHGTLPAHVSALHEPLYVAGALLLTGLTVALGLRLGDRTEAAFGATLLLGLILYPGALSSYGVVLIVPFLVLWRGRDAFPGGTATVAAILAGAVVLQSDRLELGFAANVLTWLACAYLMLVARHRAAEHPPAPVDSPAAAAVAAGVAG